MSDGDFAGVTLGRWIYVGVGSRAEFDKIERSYQDDGERDGNHVLVKTVEQDGVHVAFQHWIKWVPAHLRVAREASAVEG